MANCELCNRQQRARFEYLEMLRPLQKRIANQRRELAALNRDLVSWQKAYMQLQQSQGKTAVPGDKK